MISAEAQRKLVKSPPELWAELSDPAALGRHLGELGEIRITNAEPERSVEWEAEAARGKVQLEPSGWGTQVTLTIARELPSPAVEKESEPAREVKAELAEEAEPTSTHEAEPEPAQEATVEAPPEAIVASAHESTVEKAPEAAVGETPKEETPEQPAPRRGFFARLFRRRSRVEAPPTSETTTPAEAPTTDEPSTAIVDTPINDDTPTASESLDVKQAIEPPAVATPDHAIGSPLQSEPPAADEPTEVEAEAPDADSAVELGGAEEEIAAQSTELLNGVLDRLGAAHHRPFSRA